MTRFISLFAAAIAVLASHGGAVAAQICYRDIVEYGSVACDGSSGNSADFAGSCTARQPVVKRVQVACPPAVPEPAPTVTNPPSRPIDGKNGHNEQGERNSF